MDKILIIFLYIALIFVMYIDINKKYIPNVLNFSILILSVFIRGISEIENFFIGAACYVLPILIFYGYVSDILKREVFGFGDIKLIIALGGLLYHSEINIFLQFFSDGGDGEIIQYFWNIAPFTCNVGFIHIKCNRTHFMDKLFSVFGAILSCALILEWLI